MDLGFGGEVARLYQRYRRGYPPAVFDVLATTFGLTPQDVVVDLGCGTGQLTLPIAARVRAVVGIDPEPDMLVLARRAAEDQRVDNVSWLLGADSDLPALGRLFGDGSVGAVTVGQALHWMAHEDVFAGLRPLLRPGGGVAVVANGTPLWLQDTSWSRALRACLERWRGTELSRSCGTDTDSRRRYADALTRHGYHVTETVVEYTDEIDLDALLGGVYSSFPVDALPPVEQRTELSTMIRDALGPATRFREHVRVCVLTGRIG
ncbi:class I SAM-dependent methyltransferase [Micromonospora sp. NPDC049903]|uniref:class I SAM-dependent methyltransferase n=1 Tax=Micromonospora sp. NPDC049903 TaxID=3364276 RepID=UPI0037B77351